MKQYIKPLAILVFSAGVLLPQKATKACGPFPPPPEEYRLSFFQPNMGDVNNEFTPYYFSLNLFYKSAGTESFATSIEVDQNYKEWQAELKKPFKKDDFSKAIEDYSYLLVKDSANGLRKSNSFINLLMLGGNKEYFSYFKLAKSSEMFNTADGSQDPWGLDNSASASPALLVTQLQNLLHSTKSKFIQQRTAYVLCRLLFYGKKKDAFSKVYSNYFANSAAETWVKASAKYYNTRLLYDDSMHQTQYYQGLADVIDHSKDKRMVCIKILNEAGKDSVLPYMQTNHQKALALAAFAIRYPAYSLPAIEKIYVLDPHNKFVPLLVTREINKLEDWLLTGDYTELEEPASKSIYSDDTELENHFKHQSLVSDSIYALKLRNWLVAATGNGESDFTLAMSLCHLDFLLKDYASAEALCNKVLQGADKNSPEYLQAKINTVVISCQLKQGFDEGLREDIYSLLIYLDKINKARPIIDYNDFIGDAKDALLVYLGHAALKMGSITDACLLLSGTDKPWGEYRAADVKSAYFILYEYGRPEDFDALLAILSKPAKSNYENYFASRKADFYGDFTLSEHFDDGATNFTQHNNYWNVNKVLDLKGTYYINRDSLEQALATFKQVPASFWKDSANLYNNYLIGDPFSVNVYDPGEWNSGDSSYKNNPDKKIFVEKLLTFKRREAKETNPEIKAKLNFIIGNSYYSMTYYGKFWLMSKLWWNRNDFDEYPFKPDPSFDAHYYEAERAAVYYRRAFNITKNAKKAAFYCMYLTACANNKKYYLKNIKDNKEGRGSYDFVNDKYIFKNLLKAKSGSEDFYDKLIKECPLYVDFKRKL